MYRYIGTGKIFLRLTQNLKIIKDKFDENDCLAIRKIKTRKNTQNTSNRENFFKKQVVQIIRKSNGNIDKGHEQVVKNIYVKVKTPQKLQMTIYLSVFIALHEKGLPKTDGNAK